MSILISRKIYKARYIAQYKLHSNCESHPFARLQFFTEMYAIRQKKQRSIVAMVTGSFLYEVRTKTEERVEHLSYNTECPIDNRDQTHTV
jgi:hypothetical protein